MSQSLPFKLIKYADQYRAVFSHHLNYKPKITRQLKSGSLFIIIYISNVLVGNKSILTNFVNYMIVNDIKAYQSSEKLNQFNSINEIDPFTKSNIILMVVKQYYNYSYASSNLTRIKQTNRQLNIQNLTYFIKVTKRTNSLKIIYLSFHLINQLMNSVLLKSLLKNTGIHLSQIILAAILIPIQDHQHNYINYFTFRQVRSKPLFLFILITDEKIKIYKN